MSNCLREISNETPEDPAVKRMLKNLVDFMEKKGLRGFRKFNRCNTEAIGNALDAEQRVFEEYGVLKKVLVGELSEHGIVPTKKEDRVWRDGCGRSPKNTFDWTTRYLG